jgi:hypothetical protein
VKVEGQHCAHLLVIVAFKNERLTQGKIDNLLGRKSITYFLDPFKSPFIHLQRLSLGTSQTTTEVIRRVLARFLENGSWLHY